MHLHRFTIYRPPLYRDIIISHSDIVVNPPHAISTKKSPTAMPGQGLFRAYASGTATRKQKSFSSPDSSEKKL